MTTATTESYPRAPDNMQTILDHSWFGEAVAPVLVIGAGALGSRFAVRLAKLGFQRITVYDHDHVEEHNLGNQLYRRDHIGELKVNCLRDLVRDMHPTVQQTFCGVPRAFGSVPDLDLRALHAARIVVLAVDSLRTRRRAVEQLMSVCKDPMLRRMTPFRGECFLVDGRMSAHGGEAYVAKYAHLDRGAPKTWFLDRGASLDPSPMMGLRSPVQGLSDYLDSVGDDDDVIQELGSCGRTLNVGGTADLVSGCMEHLLLQAVNPDSPLGFQASGVIVSTRPWMLTPIDLS